jgi:hypothetical protein
MSSIRETEMSNSGLVKPSFAPEFRCGQNTSYLAMIQAVFLDFLRMGPPEQNSVRTPWSVKTDESVKSHHS